MTPPVTQVYAYRGICKHGKVRLMTVDKPEYAKDVAKDIADCIRHGLTVDRVTVEEARKSDMICPECDAAFKHKKSRKRLTAQASFPL